MSNITPFICDTRTESCLRDACPAWLGETRELCLQILHLGFSPSIHQPFFSYTGTVTPLSSDTSPPLETSHSELSAHAPAWSGSSWTWQFTVSSLSLPDPALVVVVVPVLFCHQLWHWEWGMEGLKVKVTELPVEDLATQRRDRCVVFLHGFSLVLGPICVCCQLPLRGCFIRSWERSHMLTVALLVCVVIAHW